MAPCISTATAVTIAVGHHPRQPHPRGEIAELHRHHGVALRSQMGLLMFVALPAAEAAIRPAMRLRALCDAGFVDGV